MRNAAREPKNALIFDFRQIYALTFAHTRTYAHAFIIINIIISHNLKLLLIVFIWFSVLYEKN